jgi:outer membrane protein assembly factor BamB
MTLPIVVPTADGGRQRASDFLKPHHIYYWPGSRQQVSAIRTDEDDGWLLVPQASNGLPLHGVDDDGTVYVAVKDGEELPFLVFALEKTDVGCVDCPVCEEPRWIGHERICQR